MKRNLFTASHEKADLAAVTVTVAEWDENGPNGPGLYAKVKLSDDFARSMTDAQKQALVRWNKRTKRLRRAMEQR
jgi:hypothetical protein